MPFSWSRRRSLEEKEGLRRCELCYCKGLVLKDCEMADADLAFERSQVQATITIPVVSIRNPLEGSRITLPQVGQIIRDIPPDLGVSAGGGGAVNREEVRRLKKHLP